MEVELGKVESGLSSCSSPVREASAGHTGDLVGGGLKRGHEILHENCLNGNFMKVFFGSFFVQHFVALFQSFL